MTEAYDGREVVGMDLHRRRSVLVRMTGDGRKLERFGSVILNRPCPAAEGVSKSRPDLWAGATARFRGSGKQRRQTPARPGSRARRGSPSS